MLFTAHLPFKSSKNFWVSAAVFTRSHFLKSDIHNKSHSNQWGGRVSFSRESHMYSTCSKLVCGAILPCKIHEVKWMNYCNRTLQGTFLHYRLYVVEHCFRKRTIVRFVRRMPPKKKGGAEASPGSLLGRFGTSLKCGIVGLPNVGWVSVCVCVECLVLAYGRYTHM